MKKWWGYDILILHITNDAWEDAMTHPNFLVNEAQIIWLREQLQCNAEIAQRYASMIQNKEKYLSEEFLTEEYANSVYSQHGNYYDIGAQLHRLVTVLGASYVLERDHCAGERLRDAMLHVAAFAVWTGPQNKDRDVPWRSDLSTTRIAMELATGYDLIYDMLTQDERDTIAGAVLNKGVLPLLEDWVLPQTRIHALDSMGHNWWSVCIALAGAAMLPVSDYVEPGRFAYLISQIEEALIGFLRYPGCTLFNKVPNYDEYSLFYESVGYFCYGTGELLRYLWHAERYLGRRDALRAALPAHLAEAILSFAYPYDKDGKNEIGFLNYGDSAYTANIMPMVRWLRLTGYDSEPLTAYAAIVASEEDLLSLLEKKAVSAPAAWEQLPKTSVYPKTGYAITRSSWENNATLLAVKSGYTWNHAHADAGSFVLYDRGMPILIDSGSCPYGDRLYRSYYCNDISHNVLLLDGMGQRCEDQIRGSKFPGSISDSFEKPGLFYVQADATGPVAHLCSRMYRNFLWLDDHVLVIVDEVLSHEPHTLQFLLHYNGQRVALEDRSHLITNERSRVRLYTISPDDIQATSSTGYLTSNYGTTTGRGQQELEYLTLSSSALARVHAMMHVILLNEAADNIRVQQLQGSECIGVCLDDGETTRQIWYNLRADGRRMHINSNHTLGEWDTDAYLLMTEKRAEREGIFMVSGSYLRRGNDVRYASFVKTTRYLE